VPAAVRVHVSYWDPIDCMSLTLNTNVPALTAQRNLARSGMELSRSMQRLSSGLRVNSARDDAAGLAIGNRMESQIRGTSQAIRNANDGISLLQTAEGVLGTITGNIQRVRELAVQAANGSYGDGDRRAIAEEVQQRLAEIDRMGKTAMFNGQRIFAEGGSSIGGSSAQRAVADGLRMGWLANSEKMIQQYYGIQGDGADLQIDITADSDGASGYAAFVASNTGGANGRGTNLRLSVDMANFTPPNLPDGGTQPFYNDRIIAHEMVHAVMARSTNWTSLVSTSQWFIEGSAEFIHGADERVAADVAAAAGGSQDAKIDAVVDEVASWQLTSADYSAGYIATRYLHDKLKAAGNTGGIRDFMVYLNSGGAPTMDQALTHFFGGGYDQAAFLAEIQADSGNGLSNGVMFVKNRMNLANADTGAVGGLDADGGAVKTAQSVVDDVGGQYGDNVLAGFKENWERVSPGVTATRTATLQIGADVGQTLDVQLGAMSVEALGLSEVDVASTNYSAMRAIIHLDDALAYVNRQRATLGAQTARLDSAIEVGRTATEAGSAARSRIMDADYAAETAALTRASILREAGVAIAAQANTLPRSVLALLRAA
jgi:flagellin